MEMVLLMPSISLRPLFIFPVPYFLFSGLMFFALYTFTLVFPLTVVVLEVQ